MRTGWGSNAARRVRWSACLLVVGPAATAAAETLTLEQAVALALENDRRVQNASLQVERAQKSLEAARTRRLPDFDLQVQASQLVAPVSVTFPRGAFGDIDPVGPIPAVETQVESSNEAVVQVTGKVVQPISQLRRIGLNIRASEIGRDLERERLREERLTVTNEVRRLYYSIIATERSLDAALEQLEVEHEMGRIVAAQVAREVVLQDAQMDVETRRAGQEYSILRLRDELASYKENLNIRLGRDLDADLRVAELPEALPASLEWETVQASALAQRPDLAQARLQKELAEANRRSKKSELIPDVSLALQYQSFFNVELLPRDITQVGLVLEWEPFDWGRRNKELGDRSRAVGQAQNTIDATRDRALVEVRDRWRKVEEARLLLEVRRLALTSAHEKARVAVNRRAEEAALPSDALQAEASSAEASAQYQQALLSLWTARADLEEVIGATP